MATQVGRGVTVLMPRYLDYARKRVPIFSRYVALQERVHSSDFYTFGASHLTTFWIDPATPCYRDAYLGLAFHSFTGDDGETLMLA